MFFFKFQPHIQRATNGAVLRNGIPPPAGQMVHWFCQSNYRNAARCRDLIIGPSGNNPENFDLVRVTNPFTLSFISFISFIEFDRACYQPFYATSHWVRHSCPSISWFKTTNQVLTLEFSQ